MSLLFIGLVQLCDCFGCVNTLVMHIPAYSKEYTNPTQTNDEQVRRKKNRVSEMDRGRTEDCKTQHFCTETLKIKNSSKG